MTTHSAADPQCQAERVSCSAGSMLPAASAQQIGGSFGVALLNTIATAGHLTTHSLSPAALVHGYANAAAWAADILVAAAAVLPY
jgi:hypothetical protein